MTVLPIPSPVLSTLRRSRSAYRDIQTVACLTAIHCLIAKWAKTGLFQGVAIEHVVCVEGDEAFTVRVGNVDAGLLDRAEIEGLGVDELDDEDAEEIVVSEVLRRENLGEAAEKFA
jgi:hypothetical protein